MMPQAPTPGLRIPTAGRARTATERLPSSTPDSDSSQAVRLVALLRAIVATERAGACPVSDGQRLSGEPPSKAAAASRAGSASRTTTDPRRRRHQTSTG
jgi:hypothetical protein